VGESPVASDAHADDPRVPPGVAQGARGSGRGRSVPLFLAVGLFLVLAAVLVGVGATVAGVAAGLAGLVAGAVGFFQRGRESALTSPARVPASVVMPPAPATVTVQPSATVTQPTPTTVDSAALVAEQRLREWEERIGLAERRVLAVAGQLGLSGESAADAVRDLEAWLA